MGIDRTGYQGRIIGSKQLQINKEKRFVPHKMGRPAFSKPWIEYWPANAASKYMLNELLFRQLSDRGRIAFRIESWRLVILEKISVKIIRT